MLYYRILQRFCNALNIGSAVGESKLLQAVHFDMLHSVKKGWCVGALCVASAFVLGPFVSVAKMAYDEFGSTDTHFKAALLKLRE